VVIHDFLDAGGNAAEKFVAVQDGSDFLADLGKQREALAHRGVGCIATVFMTLGGSS
jgi:hypothetical protein